MPANVGGDCDAPAYSHRGGTGERGQQVHLAVSDYEKHLEIPRAKAWGQRGAGGGPVPSLAGPVLGTTGLGPAGGEGLGQMR